MAFKENILKKIEVDRLARKVNGSLVPSGEVRKVDKASMRQILNIAGFKKIEARDLELYALTDAAPPPHLLVLDNGLAVYRSTVEDVAMRKSPTVKEMVSIRNVIKILKDDDVVVSKKEKTVERIRRACADTLDLSFTREDLDRIRLDGAASLESGYAPGIIEAMDIFAELLGYRAPPGVFAVRHCRIAGRLAGEPNSGGAYGPAVIFNKVHQTLQLIDSPVSPLDREQVDRYHRVAEGKDQAPVKGMEVFAYLMEASLSSPRREKNA